MKQVIPDTQPLDIPSEDKLSKIRRLAQSVPSAYSSAEQVDEDIKQQRDDWIRQDVSLVSKI
jgi:hypothetical protein